MRLFVALFPPPEALDHLAAAIAQLNLTRRIIPPHRWHITLAFLGDVPLTLPAAASSDTAQSATPPAVGRTASSVLPAAGGAASGGSASAGGAASSAPPTAGGAASGGSASGAARSPRFQGNRGMAAADSNDFPENATITAAASAGPSDPAAYAAPSDPVSAVPSDPVSAAPSDSASAAAADPGASAVAADSGAKGVREALAGAGSGGEWGKVGKEVAGERVWEALARVRVAVGELSVASGGRFGQVVWAGVGGDGAGLTRLSRAVRRELRAVRVESDDKRFRPHLTIARSAAGLSKEDMAKLKEYQGPSWIPTEFVLVRSELGPHPEYYRLGAWPVPTAPR